MKLERILHGGDYNPEQWLDRPDILEEDMRLLKLAKINTVTLGMFSWSMLEPEEGVFTFEWLDDVIKRCNDNGIDIIMGTPSGARPKWLAEKYPEVLRVDANRQKNLFGMRHNHCYTSPAYREKVRIIDQKLVERYGDNPHVLMWHISNEFGGECHCELCQEAFRDWLKKKYKTIDELNANWCTTFWSHRYNNFEQIESPSPRGENLVHGQNLDWRRFVSDMTIDFSNWEKKAIKDAGSDKPVTVNMMYNFGGIDYFDFAKNVDVVSWDNYPMWHKKDEILTARDCGMQHDLMRSLKKQPFLLMESSPSSINWISVSKLKKPGIHHLQSMQAIAHGSDSVLYFQMRQSRGASEKFHGAVIDHYGKADTRVFAEVQRVGQDLEKLTEIIDTNTKSQVALIYDWDNRWAMEDSQGPRNCGLAYQDTVGKSYTSFRKLGLNVDILEEDSDICGYKVVCAPMTYMYRPGFPEKVEEYVRNGGTFIATYWSGVVDESDRANLGARPYGLTEVLGLRAEEIDALYDDERNFVKSVANGATFTCGKLCELVRLTTAETLYTYGDDFYVDSPVVTVNTYKNGKAFYIGSDIEQKGLDDIYKKICKEAGVELLMEDIPEEVEVCTRSSEDHEYVFIQNFAREKRCVTPISGELLLGEGFEIPAYGTVVIKR